MDSCACINTRTSTAQHPPARQYHRPAGQPVTDTTDNLVKLFRVDLSYKKEQRALPVSSVSGGCVLPAKITRCGHIYCWSCMLHYLSLDDKSWRKCPICYEAVHEKDLKRLTALLSHRRLR